MCKGRTGGGRSVSKTGREASTTEEQRCGTDPDAEAELALILGAWADLPEPARQAILGAVLAFQAPLLDILARPREQ